MGKDCERILSSINKIKDIISSSITNISNAANYRINSEGEHNEQEREHEVDTSFISSIESEFDSFSIDMEKMKSLESNMYTNSTNFNNSYGSPWKELHVLENSIKTIINFDTSGTKFIGGKITLLGIMNIALSAAVDAKWALTIYHDYIQRGFDAKYNSKTPSVVFKKANKEDSIGNVNQNFTENVNIPAKSIDPY